MEGGTTTAASPQVATSAGNLTHCALFKLPPELRNEIYSYVFTPPGRPILPFRPKRYPSLQIALPRHSKAPTQVSRAVRQETLPIYHSVRTYELGYTLVSQGASDLSQTWAPLDKWLKGLDPAAGTGLVNFSIDMTIVGRCAGQSCGTVYKRYYGAFVHFAFDLAKTSDWTSTIAWTWDCQDTTQDRCPVKEADIDGLVKGCLGSKQGLKVTLAALLKLRVELTVLFSREMGVAICRTLRHDTLPHYHSTRVYMVNNEYSYMSPSPEGIQVCFDQWLQSID